jgi:hypothetical protein
MKDLKGLTYRVAVAVFALMIALAALEAGVGLSGQPGLPQAAWPTKVYYALGLFVLGGLDLGVPSSGPWWGKTMMWVAYFGCPAIATAAVVEGVGRLLQRRRDGLANLTDHTVIVGDTKLAELYVDSLGDPTLAGRDLLLIDPETHQPTASDSRARKGLKQVTGDITSKLLGERVDMDEASLVLLLTDDDVANLEAGLFIRKQFEVDPEKLVVHLSDIALKRDVEEADNIPEDLTLFNSHEIAAEHLLEEQIETFFHGTDYADEVVLAGFGRFGQSMLEQLDREMPGEFDSVVLMDPEASFEHRVFDEQVDLNGDYSVHTIDGDMRDPDNWDEAMDHLDEATKEPVIVLGADDDAVNLQVALWLQRRDSEAKLYVRTMGSTRLADAMVEEDRFEIENVDERIVKHMEQENAFGLEESS